MAQLNAFPELSLPIKLLVFKDSEESLVFFFVEEIKNSLNLHANIEGSIREAKKVISARF